MSKRSNDSRRLERDQTLDDLWKKWIRRGWEAKKKFTARSAEVASYFEGDHDAFYESEAVRQWADLDDTLKITVNLAFQIRGWLAPNLYQRNPTRTVTVKTQDSWLKAMARTIEAYLNYTPNEAKLRDESRLGIDEGLLDGRGCLYTGWNEQLGIVSSRFVSIDDVVIDPDAKRVKDAMWVAVRRWVPWWKLVDEFGDKAREAWEAAPRGGAASPLDEGEGTESLSTQEREVEEGTNDLACVYDVYSKMGVGWRGLDVPEEFADLDDSIDFRKLTLVDGWDRPLFLGRWESPIYLDDAWPLSFVDLTPTKNQLWPVSLMAAALPNQRAVNLMSTVELEKAKQYARDITAIKGSLKEDVKDRIEHGGLNECIELNSNDPAETLNSLIQRLPPTTMSPEVRATREFHMQMFGEVTGLLPILKGSSSEQQIRSATEADLKDKNARSRVGDLNELVEDWQSDVARAEGILVRLTLDPDEVSKFVGEVELGWLIEPTWLGTPLPHRTAPPGSPVKPPPYEEGKEPSPSVCYLAPWADALFPSEEVAAQAAQRWVALLPQMRLQWKLSTGLDLFVDEVPPIVRRATVDDVWAATSYLTAKDIVREVSFRIESGSTKRPDPNKAVDHANTLMSTVGQPALQLAMQTMSEAGFDTYNRVLKSMFDALGFPEDKRVFLDGKAILAAMQAQQQAMQQQAMAAGPPPKGAPR